MKTPYFITHIRSHTGLLGLLTEGNEIVDQFGGYNMAFKTSQLLDDIFHQKYVSY